MKIKTMWKQVLVLSLAVALCIILTPAAIAADANDIVLELEVSSNSEITYRVVSAREYKNAVAVTSVYMNGRMVDNALDTFDIVAGTTEKSHSFDKAFDDIKVILLDGTRYTPLCLNAGNKSVKFFDYDGTLLSEQKVLSGQSAVPPVAKEREGYVFVGWGGDYSSIFDDCAFTAQYVANDAMNIFSISSGEANVGDEIVVSVDLGGTVQICGYNMNFIYDNSVLEFVSVDAALSMDVLANPITDEGRIKFNFSSTKNRTKSGEIMDITFRVLDTETGHTRMYLKPVEVISIDPDNSTKFVKVEYTACEGVILIK